MSIVTFSKYQTALFNWVEVGRGDAIVNAVAGAGKSFSLVEVVQRVKGTVLMVAFNKHAAEALLSKINAITTLEGIDVKTIHALGMKALRRIAPRLNVKDFKYSDILGDRFENREDAQTALRVFDLARASLVDMSDIGALVDIAEHHGIDVKNSEVFDVIPFLASNGIDMARNSGIIDFTDMIWLPNVLNLTIDGYNWVLCDECQDLSKAQLELVLKARGKGGRMLFVGDPRQSIYGFAGADANSFWAIKERLGAVELPLSICYRCPKEVIKLAQEIVPQIEAAPDAIDGIVTTIKETAVAEAVREGDLILCRLTAPLIKLCIQLIKNRIPARVRGRDIAKSLVTIIKKVAKANRGAFTVDALYAWSDKEEARITTKKNHENALQAHQDRIAGILACYEAMGSLNTDDFCREIESLFSDGRASVILSTIHRAKGLEENRVFILYPERLVLTFAKQNDWQYEQELNGKYVALTRAMKELIFVEEVK